MTDAQIKEIEVGDNLRLYRGKDVKPLDIEVAQVIERGVCKATHARGAAWACVRSKTGSRHVLESDEYITGSYNETFDTGVRIDGCEKAPEPKMNLFGGMGLNRP